MLATTVDTARPIPCGLGPGTSSGFFHQGHAALAALARLVAGDFWVHGAVIGSAHGLDSGGLVELSITAFWDRFYIFILPPFLVSQSLNCWISLVCAVTIICAIFLVSASFPMATSASAICTALVWWATIIMA